MRCAAGWERFDAGAFYLPDFTELCYQSMWISRTLDYSKVSILTIKNFLWSTKTCECEVPCVNSRACIKTNLQCEHLRSLSMGLHSAGNLRIDDAHRCLGLLDRCPGRCGNSGYCAERAGSCWAEEAQWCAGNDTKTCGNIHTYGYRPNQVTSGEFPTGLLGAFHEGQGDGKNHRHGVNYRRLVDGIELQGVHLMPIHHRGQGGG